MFIDLDQLFFHSFLSDWVVSSSQSQPERLRDWFVRSMFTDRSEMVWSSIRYKSSKVAHPPTVVGPPFCFPKASDRCVLRHLCSLLYNRCLCNMALFVKEWTDYEVGANLESVLRLQLRSDKGVVIICQSSLSILVHGRAAPHRSFSTLPYKLLFRTFYMTHWIRPRGKCFWFGMRRSPLLAEWR